MIDEPLVSIVTPNHNYGRFLCDTISSVKNQDYDKIEHIVVDAASTDDTLRILESNVDKYNLTWISEPDQGQSDAINKGFALGRGRIVAELDSDDVYLTKDVVSYVVDQFMKHPEVDVIFGNDALVNENNVIFSVRKVNAWDYDRVLRGRAISQPATFFRREVIDQNLWRTDLKYSMDLEYWLRLGKRYRFLRVDKILAGNRIHKARKRLSSRKLAEIEDRRVLQMYGQEYRFSSTVRSLIDIPEMYFRRLLGIRDLLDMRKHPSNLAFNGKFARSMLGALAGQIVPSLWVVS